MEIIIPDITYAEIFSNFLKKTAGETTFLSFDVEEAPDTEAAESMIRILSMGKNVLFLAVDGKEIAGSLTLRGRENRKRLSHVGEIGIVVAREYWGRGIGRKLMEEVISFAGNNQFRKLTLKVVEGNEKAVGLYEKLGFVREGLLRDEVRIGDSYYSYIVMGLFIDR